jgi:GST-like protein
MIDLYTWTTPNAQKVSVMLEETALPYTVHAVDISKGDHQAPAFLAINPHGKVPAIVDRDPAGGVSVTLAESSAILVHLAEKSGRLLAPAGPARAAAFHWLMFQTSNIGPTFHDAYYFLALAPERLPAAIAYFDAEIARVLGLLDAELARHGYLGGAYSIADVATFPWIATALTAGVRMPANVRRWHDRVAARPAVARGMAVPATA